MEGTNSDPFVKEPEGKHRHELALLRVKGILRPPDIHWKTGVYECGDQAGSPVEKPAAHERDDPDAQCAHDESGQSYRPLGLAKEQARNGHRIGNQLIGGGRSDFSRNPVERETKFPNTFRFLNQTVLVMVERHGAVIIVTEREAQAYDRGQE